MDVSVKICGLTSDVAVGAVIASGANYAGFVHFPASPRHLSLGRIAQLQALLPASIPSVLVVVDPDDALITQAEFYFSPNYIQLHGNETPQRVAQIRHICGKAKLIKALSVRSAEDIAQAQHYIDHVEMLMFDAKAPATPGMLPGGNGLTFDWTLLSSKTFTKPWMLSGGLNAANVQHAIRHSGAHIVDVSSGVESAPGVKDPALIHQFVKAAQHA